MVSQSITYLLIAIDNFFFFILFFSYLNVIERETLWIDGLNETDFYQKTTTIIPYEGPPTLGYNRRGNFIICLEDQLIFFF